MMRSLMQQVLMIMLVGLVSLSATGCSPLVRERTLPPSIRSVYVPMVVNRTSEPGLEERVTVALQKELLADGRLNVVRKRGSEADAVINVTLTNFENRASYFDSDDFPAGQAFHVDAEIEIRENIPGRPALGGERTVRTAVNFNADPRTTTFDPEPQSKDVLYRQLARQIVQEILTGEFEETGSSTNQQQSEDEQTRPII